MAQPQPYNRQFNFADQQALTPSTPLPGTQVDAEFNQVKLTLDQTLANLAKIQRDDGALRNGIVTQDSLSSSLSIGFTLRGAWSAGVSYLLSDGVTYSNKFYKATASHLSTNDNAPDDPGAPWLLVADFTALASDAAASAAAALASENAAAASASAASSSASAAASSASAASGSADASAASAVAAEASADAAAASAQEAANLIGGTVTQAVRWDVAQTLSEGERQQARTNIGATSAGSAIITAANAVTQRTALGANSDGSDIFTGATSIGKALGTAASAAAGRTAINAPPAPTDTSGAGQFTSISATAGSSLVLPAGGTWAWWRIPRDVATNGFAGGITAGVAAGGTTISTGSAGVIFYGACWRIA